VWLILARWLLSRTGLVAGGVLVAAVVSVLLLSSAPDGTAPQVDALAHSMQARERLRRGQIGKDNRFVEPGPELHFAVEPSANAVLRTSFGVERTAWRHGLEEIEFLISFRSGENRTVLFRRRLGKDDQRRWYDAIVPLATVKERHGEITLEAEVRRGPKSLKKHAFWTPPSFGPARADDAPSIILVSIDTLRADHLSCYGYRRQTSPNLDRLAKQGTLFRQAIAPASWTLPSHASMLTGLYPHHHGATRFRPLTPLADDVDTLAELLWDDGYATAAFTGGLFVSSATGFAQGFDVFQTQDFDLYQSHRRFPAAIGAAIDWMKRTRGPFFLFLHTYDVHLPYAPQPPYDTMFDPDYQGRFAGQFTTADFDSVGGTKGLDRRTVEHLEALYDGGIRQTDHVFATLLQYLQSSHRARNTCVIVTSDHGEEFLEHGHMFHNHAVLYEELIRVPLIVRCPSGYAGGRVIEQPVSLVDLVPTVLDITGTPTPEGMDGQSLLPALLGRDPAQGRTVLSEVDASVEDKEGSVVAVRTAHHKLVRESWAPATPQLFDLEKDPEERHDVGAEQPAVVSRLSAVLRADGLTRPQPAAAGLKARAAPLTPDAATRERMRELGYKP
jgi:arylsulfatase A-like enzyme